MLLLIFYFFKLAETLNGQPRIIRSPASADPVSTVSGPSEKPFLIQPAGVIEDIGNTFNDITNAISEGFDGLSPEDQTSLFFGRLG